MVLGGELATSEAIRQFKTLGTDLLAVSLNTSPEKNDAVGKKENLSLSQALVLGQSDPQIASVAPYTQLFYPDRKSVV